MVSRRPATTVRFSDEDLAILAKLQQIPGLVSATAVIRMAIRGALDAREKWLARR